MPETDTELELELLTVNSSVFNSAFIIAELQVLSVKFLVLRVFFVSMVIKFEADILLMFLTIT